MPFMSGLKVGAAIAAVVAGVGLAGGAHAQVTPGPRPAPRPAQTDPSDTWDRHTSIGLELGPGGVLTSYDFSQSPSALLFYAAVLRTVADQWFVAAFSLSLLLFFWFGWEIHQSVSHTLALLAGVLALFIASLAYAERPTAMRAFLLGLIIGLGLMAK